MKRPLCTLGFTFVASALLASFLSCYVMKLIIIILTVLAIPGFFCLKGDKRKIFILCMLSGILAVSMFYIKTEFEYNKVVTLDGKSTTVTGKVYDLSVSENGTYKYFLHADKLESYNVPKFDVIIYSNEDLEFDYYDTVQVYASFYKPAYSYGFDSVRYYSGENIFILGYTDGVGAYVTDTNHKSIMYLIKDTNRYLKNILDDMFEADIASVIKAIVLGDTDNVSFNLKYDYLSSGTYHVFAISGFHIAVISEFLMFLFSLFRLNRKFSFIITLAVIYGFTVFSGMHIATVRAAIMLTITLVGKMFYQKSDSLNSLSVSALIICFANIYNIMSLSFILTFASSLGIILFSKKIFNFLADKFYDKSVLLKIIFEVFSMTISTSICLLPVYIFSFGYISIVSFIANFIIYFTATPIIVMSFLLIVFILLSGPKFIIAPLGKVLSLFVKAQNNFMSILSDFKHATIGLNYDYIKLWLLISVLIFAVLLLAGRGRRYIKKAAVICILIFIIMSAAYNQSMRQSAQMYILGDGTASNIVLLTEKSVTVISAYDDSYIDSQTLSFLRSKGINEIDNLIYTCTKLRNIDDNYNLVDNIKVNCILYNKNNTDIFDALNRTNVSYVLNKIDDCTVKIGDNMSLRFFYINTKISGEINLFDKTINLSNNTDRLLDIKSDITLIYDNADYKNISGIPSDTVIMLTSPYIQNDSENDFIKGYENTLCFLIKERQDILIK